MLLGGLDHWRGGRVLLTELARQGVLLGGRSRKVKVLFWGDENVDTPGLLPLWFKLSN